MEKRRVFVAGATGAVGQTLLPLAQRLRVDVLAHARPKSAGKVGHSEVAALELDDPKLVDAMKGCTTVVQLIGTMRKRFGAGDTYETSDIGTTRLLVDAARKTGTVDHVVLLSSVGAGRPVGAYLKAKAEAERLVTSSGLAWTIFRPSAFEDRDGVRVPGMRAITSALGLKKYQPITLRELAAGILDTAVHRRPVDAVLEGASLWAVVERAPRE